MWGNAAKLPVESLLIPSASSRIQYSHNLLLLLKKNLISLDSAEWTEMLDICICLRYRSPILLPGFIVNNWFLSFSNVSISISTFQAPPSKFLGTVQEAWPETSLYFAFYKMRRRFVELAPFLLTLLLKWFPRRRNPFLSSSGSPTAEQLATQGLKRCSLTREPTLPQSERRYHQCSPASPTNTADRIQHLPLRVPFGPFLPFICI